jgi:translation initiation factor 5B
VISIQINNADVKEAKKGEEVAMKLELSAGQQKVMAGRHFDESSKLYSKLSRESINKLKENFKDDVDDDGWRCVIKIKRLLQIQ